MNQKPTTYTIVCPACKQKQTGILKIAEHFLSNHYPEISVENYNCVIEGDAYIICCMPNCKHVITDNELEEVTRQVVKGPSDLNKY